MPLPSSELPGHKSLHERVVAALGRCQESQDIDFKEAGDWSSLKWKVIRTSMAMANLRDGGLVVIGVGERGDSWELAGVSEDIASTYEPDLVIDQVNAFASPHVDLDIVRVRHDGRTFVAIQAREFDATPVVCKKQGPEGKVLKRGTIYVRPPGKAETTEITDAGQLHDLLELAAEKRARRILEVSGRIGLLPREAIEPNDDEKFARELGEL